MEQDGARWSKMEQDGSRWSKVEESGAKWESSEQRGKVRSNVEECRQIWRGLEQNGEVWSKMEEFGGTWRSPERRGKVRSNLEECREIWKGLEVGNITGFETRRGLRVWVGVAKLIPPPNPHPQDGSRVLAILPAGLARARFFFNCFM